MVLQVATWHGVYFYPGQGLKGRRGGDLREGTAAAVESLTTLLVPAHTKQKDMQNGSQ